jgi:hypothetical protein
LSIDHGRGLVVGLVELVFGSFVLILVNYLKLNRIFKRSRVF